MQPSDLKQKVQKLSSSFDEVKGEIDKMRMSNPEKEQLIAYVETLATTLKENPNEIALKMATTALDILKPTIKQALDAGIDTLTGLPDRKTLQATYDHVIERINDGKIGSATMVMIDANKFKAVNDYLGHTTGDRALQCYANILRGNTPESDYVARIGGDEFLIIIEHRTQKPEDEKNMDWVAPKAIEIIDGIKEIVNSASIYADHPDKENLEVPLGLSFGLHTIDTKLPLEQNFKTADQALYKAKQGRPDIYAEIRKLRTWEAIHGNEPGAPEPPAN